MSDESPPKIRENRANGNRGKGRPKGSPNKATASAREAIAQFVDSNSGRLQGWLESIAADDPRSAFNCFLSLLEYHVPKLARTELTGPDGGPIETKEVSPLEIARHLAFLLEAGARAAESEQPSDETPPST